MPAIHQTAKQLHAQLCFGRFSVIIGIAKQRITANLPDFHKLGENLDFASLKVCVTLLFQIIAHTDDLRIIELLLLALHPGVSDFLKLVRKIPKDISLDSPENERRNHFVEPLQDLFVLVFHDRNFHLRAEAVVCKQKSRHQIVKNRPQL